MLFSVVLTGSYIGYVYSICVILEATLFAILFTLNTFYNFWILIFFNVAGVFISMLSLHIYKNLYENKLSKKEK